MSRCPTPRRRWRHKTALHSSPESGSSRFPGDGSSAAREKRKHGAPRHAAVRSWRPAQTRCSAPTTLSLSPDTALRQALCASRSPTVHGSEHSGSSNPEPRTGTTSLSRQNCRRIPSGLWRFGEDILLCGRVFRWGVYSDCVAGCQFE